MHVCFLRWSGEQTAEVQSEERVGEWGLKPKSVFQTACCYWLSTLKDTPWPDRATRSDKISRVDFNPTSAAYTADFNKIWLSDWKADTVCEQKFSLNSPEPVPFLLMYLSSTPESLSWWPCVVTTYLTHGFHSWKIILKLLRVIPGNYVFTFEEVFVHSFIAVFFFNWLSSALR